MNCIVLAGGFGQRLRSLLPDTPKPLAPISGKPFLSYLIQFWQKQGVDRFILATGYKGEEIESYIFNNRLESIVEISRENTPLGTGGAFLKASRLIKSKEPFLLINGDTFFPISLEHLKRVYSQNKASVLIPLNQKNNSSQRFTSIQFDKNLRVLTIGPSEQENPWVSTGTYLISPEVLQLWENKNPPLNFETDLLAHLCINKNQNVVALPVTDTSFIDIGTPEDYNRAQKLIPEAVR